MSDVPAVSEVAGRQIVESISQRASSQETRLDSNFVQDSNSLHRLRGGF